MNVLTETPDQKLRARARRVIPGGMYGHMRSEALPSGYPQFFERAAGCHIWDVNGRRYLDFMCSWGPIVLGHNHPVVTEAVQRQMAQGDCMDGPSERMVELAERLVGLLPHADWAIFAKNGTDGRPLAWSWPAQRRGVAKSSPPRAPTMARFRGVRPILLA